MEGFVYEKDDFQFDLILDTEFNNKVKACLNRIDQEIILEQKHHFIPRRWVI